MSNTFKDPEHQLLSEQILQMQKTFDRFYEDFREDTRARGRMEVNVKNTENLTGATREDVGDLPKEVKRAVDDGMKPIEKKLNKIVSSKQAVIHYIEDKRKINFLSKLKFWKRG